MSSFSCIRPSLSKVKKKNHIVFSYNKENFKYIYISMHFGFNNQFIKVTRTRPIFQKNQKNILFCFNVLDYEFIRKTYCRY
jgi:hypothetical protein